MLRQDSVPGVKRRKAYQSDLLEVISDPMFGTLDMYLKTTSTEIEIFSESEALLGTIELFIPPGGGHPKTRFVKTFSTQRETWLIWKESKTAYPIRCTDPERYLNQVELFKNMGQSDFNAQRSAEEAIGGPQIDWRSYIKILQSFWRMTTGWQV